MTCKATLASGVLEAIESGNWRTVLAALEISHGEGTSDLHWVKPDYATLRMTCEKFHQLGISSIMSIGSGSGVFEWLLSRIDPNIQVRGVEIDEPWWNSNYSFGPVIPTTFTPLYDTPASKTDWTSMTLLFCYFNDSDEFSKYVDWFKGKWIVIIGPTKASGRHCSPMPSDGMRFSEQLNLNSLIKFESNLDEIAFYSCKN